MKSWRRPLLILLAVAVGSVTLFAGAYLLAKRLAVTQMMRSTDDLAWLQKEFHLTAAEMQRVRQLHEGYLPQCRQMCERIAAKNSEVQQALASAANPTPTAEQKLAELAALRAQCQTQMLRHFYEVSQVMPPEQGRRYLAEMQRLTLGFHTQIEQSMEPQATPGHGHH